MTVRVPVAVKAKVTEDLKLKIIGDLQNTIKNMELDLEQFEFQAKKALHQAASDLSVLPALREQIDMERNKRTAAKAEAEAKLKRAEALEMGASHYPDEFGGFCQVAGMEYTINSKIPSTVQLDEKGNFYRIGGIYRVSDVRIGGKPLDINKKYTVGGTTYVLKDGGDGFVMFKGSKLLKDGEKSDVDAIMEYIQKQLDGKIGEQYNNPYGDGRIRIK